MGIFGNEESQLGKGKMPIAGALNAKKMKRAMGANTAKKTVDENKELMRLKKEIREKKLLEKKAKELEQ